MDIYLDPHDPAVIAAARKNGVADSTITAAQNSPVYKFVKEWGLALPLHPEFRTLPNLFYIATYVANNGSSRWEGVYETTSKSLFPSIDQNRLPMKYLASLFTAGDTDKVREVYDKLLSVKCIVEM